MSQALQALAKFFADVAIRAIVERQVVGALEEFYPLVSSSKAPRNRKTSKSCPCRITATVPELAADVRSSMMVVRLLTYNSAHGRNGQQGGTNDGGLETL